LYYLYSHSCDKIYYNKERDSTNFMGGCLMNRILKKFLRINLLANAETARTVSFCSGGFLHLFFFLLLHLFMGFLLNIISIRQ